MQDCDHADAQYQYTRFKSGQGAIHYAIKCPACNKLVRTIKHGGRLLIKHSEIPAGQIIHDLEGDSL